jgi:two-component system, OmpR family, sensor kinase
VSLRARLLAAFAYVLVLVIVALEVPLALNLSRRVDAEIRSEAQGQAQLLASLASGRLGDRADLSRLVARGARDLGGRVIVVDSRGRLRADSAGSGLGSSSYASRPEVAAAIDGRTDQGTRHSDSLDQDLLYTAVPVVRDGRTIGAVRVTQSVDAVHAEVRDDVWALIGVGVVALLLGLGVAWLLAGSLARPLRGLARAAGRVAGGDLDARTAVEGSAEQQEVAAAFNDMTERLARVLRAQQEFVANASHQLRTPLTGLRLRLEAAASKADDPGLERDLVAAEAETERLARLLTELLTLARERQRPPARQLDLAEVVDAAAERWAARAERSGHTLSLRGEGSVRVDSSADDLAAMLDNLVENALTYSPAGSAVTLGWGRDGATAWLAVLDEGPGIDADDGERVFERFYRGTASHAGAAGTGLGLPVVEALARRWDGEASLANRPEGGARAMVRLPARAAADDASLPSADSELDVALPERGYGRPR